MLHMLLKGKEWVRIGCSVLLQGIRPIARNCNKKCCIYCEKSEHIIKECPTQPQNHQSNAFQAMVNSSSSANDCPSVASVVPTASPGQIVLTPEMVQQIIILVISAWDFKEMVRQFPLHCLWTSKEVVSDFLHNIHSYNSTPHSSN